MRYSISESILSNTGHVNLSHQEEIIKSRDKVVPYLATLDKV
jgi:hypothetical protein